MSNNEQLIYTFKLPNGEEYFKFEEKFPVKELLDGIRNRNVQNIVTNPFNVNDLKEGEKKSVLETWLNNIDKLIFDAQFAFSLLHYFKNEGIPDNPVWISPGKKGESIQLFPNFEAQHWYNQDMFRIFAELTISKIFSILDNVATLLMTKYGNHDIVFGSSRGYYHVVVKRLAEGSNDKSLQKMLALTENPLFVDAKEIRNDILHNRTPLMASINTKLHITDKATIMSPEIKYLSTDRVIEIINFLIWQVSIETLDSL
ncbi:Cthe_2314 family HEPN domain-containing protein [Leptospira noguchii]|uniref:Cthe_2314 family HEPN domain-containing protein n=1 Tax=Leptospira noguchii TaxID=28182 RepID=UPI000772DDE1|nr:Cthe_2314 family HEPN domain-containing protein [Leptospira noguchii]UOG50905.1 Cthe_2314 family HEPN domain-containing protein [Leptospira noguchii]